MTKRKRRLTKTEKKAIVNRAKMTIKKMKSENLSVSDVLAEKFPNMPQEQRDKLENQLSQHVEDLRNGTPDTLDIESDDIAELLEKVKSNVED